MGYQEVDFNLCRQCWINLKKPSKKAIKNVFMTVYRDQCENCHKIDRLVDCTWEKDEEEE